MTAQRPALVSVLAVLVAVLVGGMQPAPADAATAGSRSVVSRSAAAPIRDLQLRICIRHQWQLDHTRPKATPTTADLARLTRLDCPAPAHIHGWTMDFTELARGTRLTFIRYWTDAPPEYQDLSPLSRLRHLTMLYENVGRCRLPIAPVHGTCTPVG